MTIGFPDAFLAVPRASDAAGVAVAFDDEDPDELSDEESSPQPATSAAAAASAPSAPVHFLVSSKVPLSLV
jgi:hypothetical protein